MSRPRGLIAVALALIVLAVVVVAVAAGGGGGGDEDDGAGSTRPTPSGRSADEGPPPTAAPGGLPPQFLECMAAEGFPIESPTEIHSAPQDVLQKCFGALH